MHGTQPSRAQVTDRKKDHRAGGSFSSPTTGLSGRLGPRMARNMAIAHISWCGGLAPTEPLAQSGARGRRSLPVGESEWGVLPAGRCARAGRKSRIPDEENRRSGRALDASTMTDGNEPDLLQPRSSLSLAIPRRRTDARTPGVPLDFADFDGESLASLVVIDGDQHPPIGRAPQRPDVHGVVLARCSRRPPRVSGRAAERVSMRPALELATGHRGRSVSHDR